MFALPGLCSLFVKCEEHKKWRILGELRMMKFWITLGKQAALFAICALWWELVPTFISPQGHNSNGTEGENIYHIASNFV